MTIVHLHLLLNHFPVVGAIVGIFLLAAAWFRKSDELGKAALGLFAILGFITVIVFLTGEPAEEVVEQLPGYSAAITERHEESALAATVAMSALGLLSLAALGIFRRKPMDRRVTALALLLALGVAGMIGFTANLGGQIRHTEIRPAAIPMGSEPTDDAEESRERR